MGAGELVYSKQRKRDWVSRFLEICTLAVCTGSWKAAHYSLEILTFITILPLHSNLPSSSSSCHFEEQVPWSLLKISQMTGLFPALLNSIDRCFGWKKNCPKFRAITKVLKIYCCIRNVFRNDCRNNVSSHPWGWVIFWSFLLNHLHPWWRWSPSWPCCCCTWTCSRTSLCRLKNLHCASNQMTWIKKLLKHQKFKKMIEQQKDQKDAQTEKEQKCSTNCLKSKSC